jgi:divalent metal cation (Fe/Co/Zn/Cd) transporter
MNIERWGWYSIGINVVLIVINAGIAAVSGSLAVEAELVHNLVDLLTAIGVLMMYYSAMTAQTGSFRFSGQNYFS